MIGERVVTWESAAPDGSESRWSRWRWFHLWAWASPDSVKPLRRHSR